MVTSCPAARGDAAHASGPFFAAGSGALTTSTMPLTAWVQLSVDDGTSMRAWVARPDAGPRDRQPAGLLVLQEAFGVNAHIRDVAERFARQGYVAIAPELFHRTAPGFDGRYDDFPSVMPHLQALTPDGMIADMRAAHGWLASEGGVAATRTGAVGFCMGGRAAYLGNSALPLAASVSYYGGGIAPGLLDRASSLHGRQLFYWGGKDRNIKPEHHRAVADALREAAKPFASVEFSNADHGFFCDARPVYDPAAARESWALTLAFLADAIA